MSEIRQYIFSVVCCSVICGFIQILFTGSAQSAVKFVTGLVLVIVVINPLIQGTPLLNLNWESLIIDRQLAVQEGEISGQNAMRAYIKESTETYILDKAMEMGADVMVEVEVDESTLPVPISVMVKGMVSPHTKQKLKDIIQEDLGITKDQQRWIS